MNNKIYIVSYYVEDKEDWDLIHDDILGIFSSREKAEEAIKKEWNRLNLIAIDNFNFVDDLFIYSFSIKEGDFDNTNCCVVTPKDLWRHLYEKIDEEEET